LAAVRRAVHSAGQTQLYLTPVHAEAGLIKTRIANVQAATSHVKRAAHLLLTLNRWKVLVGYICERKTE
jgi:hypothetical protein